MAKIDLFSGFLGAGKTTLIKKLIKEAYQNEKIVLIENEFGEIGIDGHFLEEAGIEIKEMNSGCICCSLVGDFSEALKKVHETYQPDRILIEPSGVGKLSDVIEAVKSLNDDTSFTLNNTVCVVDARKVKMYMKNFGEFYNNQIEYAKTIILSRTQGMSEELLENVIHSLRDKNHEAVLIATPWNDLSGAILLKEMENSPSLFDEMMNHTHHNHENCHCGHHHAEEVFTSWGVETMHSYQYEDLQDILVNLSQNKKVGTILRAKGIVVSKDQKFLAFDMVPSEIDIRECSTQAIGKICVIGSQINEEELKQLFQLKV